MPSYEEQKQQIFKETLEHIRQILEINKVHRPPCFISYAWESDPDSNRKLQTWLFGLKEDLKIIGIEVFLNISNMYGAMRTCMEENIRRGGYILLIGTPQFKERVEQDRLYRMSRSTFNIYQELSTEQPDVCKGLFNSLSKGKSIVLIEDDGTICFLEHGKFLHEEVAMARQFNFDEISWEKTDKYGIHSATSNKHVNEIIDQAKSNVHAIIKTKSHTFGNGITNVAFEFGFTLEKEKQDSNSLIPLLYSGDFQISFPHIVSSHLIRDMRNLNDYYNMLIGLCNPLGVIPAMYPKLMDDIKYCSLLQEFCTKMQSIVTAETAPELQERSYIPITFHYNPKTKSTFKKDEPSKHELVSADIDSYAPTMSYRKALKKVEELDSKPKEAIVVEDVKALNDLGEHCYNGTDGAIQNYEKAVQYFLKAAAQGYAISQYNLGICYRSGNGVPKDYNQAAGWFLQAAKQGDADAQNILGNYYIEGRPGVPKDLDKGMSWLNRAATRGNPSAEFNLAVCYHQGTVIHKDHKMAFKWYNEAANHGHVEAQYYVGLCHEKGWGTEVDFDRANEWYVKAASHGNEAASQRIKKLAASQKESLSSPSPM